MTEPDPDPDVIDLLLEQHARIEMMFYEIELLEGPRRRAAFDDIVRLIAVHETAEEESAHRLARERLLDGDELVTVRMEEEREIRRMLVRLVDAGVDYPGFDEALLLLRDAVLAHIRHEERFEFPQLRELVPADRLHELAFAVRAAEEVALTRPGSSAR